MESRISKTNEKYRKLRQEYERLKGEGLDENKIRVALGLTPVQFHALKNKEYTSGVHGWSRGEEQRLLELYKAHGTRWEAIRDAMSGELGVSLTAVQVKNKLYAMRKNRVYAGLFRGEGMPQTPRGRRPRMESRRRARRQPPPAAPAPQAPRGVGGLQGVEDPGYLVLPDIAAGLGLGEAAAPFPDIALPEMPPAPPAPADPGLAWMLPLSWGEEGLVQSTFNFSLF